MSGFTDRLSNLPPGVSDGDTPGNEAEPEASTSPDAVKERAAMSFGKLPDETAEEVIRSALRAERANERALIVRYLHDHLLNDLAERIERGDHLKAHA